MEGPLEGDRGDFDWLSVVGHWLNGNADDRIDEIAARHSIPVTNLAPALSSYAELNHVYLNGFRPSNYGAGHWNETGHRLAAETIAADLCRQTMAKVASPSQLRAEK